MSRSTTLELCKNTALLQDDLKQLTKSISQELPDISKSVSALRQDLLSGIRERNNLEHDTEKKVQNALANVKLHMEEATDLQKSLAGKSDASSAELRRWQNELRFSCQALYDCSQTHLDLLLKCGAKIDALSKPELPATNWLQIVLSTVQIISTVVSGLGTISSLASQPPMAKLRQIPPTTLPYRLLNSPETSPSQPSDEDWNKAYSRAAESFSPNDMKLLPNQGQSTIDGRTPGAKTQSLPPHVDDKPAADFPFKAANIKQFDRLWQTSEKATEDEIRLWRHSHGDQGFAESPGIFTCNFEACRPKHIEFSRFADLKRYYKNVHIWKGLDGVVTIFDLKAARNLLPKEKDLKEKAKDGVILDPSEQFPE